MRYHISKETGRPSICRAKSSETCRAVPMFNESVVPHFDNKFDAQKYIEEQLSKDDVLMSLKIEEAAQRREAEKRKEAIEKSLKRFQQLKDKYGYSYAMDPFSFEDEDEGNKKIESVSDFVHEELSDYDEVQTVEQTNYRAETVVHKDGLFYVISFYGGYEIDGFSLLGAVPAEKVFRNQIGAEAVLVEDIKDEHSLSMIDEFTSTFDQLEVFEPYSDDGDKSYKLLGPISQDTWGVVLEREDGSKIHGFNVSSQQSDSVLDLPYPVQFDEEMEADDDNEMMEKGYILFDTRNGKGFALIYRDASEDGGDPYFEWHKDRIVKAKKNNHFQRIYMLSASKEEITKEYFKVAE